jgi:hypothetical protein
LRLFQILPEAEDASAGLISGHLLEQKSTPVSKNSQFSWLRAMKEKLFHDNDSCHLLFALTLHCHRENGPL